MLLAFRAQNVGNTGSENDGLDIVTEGNYFLLWKVSSFIECPSNAPLNVPSPSVHYYYVVLCSGMSPCRACEIHVMFIITFPMFFCYP